MPIDLESLLQPISDSQPSGADLRNHPLYIQIREARRQEEDLAQGVWAREIKEADYVLSLKLCKEALIKRGKDLQVAAWLTEALLRQEGFAGLEQGLTLIARMLETFWDTLHPQIDEDGDLEMRATPLRWVASQLDNAIRAVPLTRGKHSWYQYKQSRAIPTEEVARMDTQKGQLRAEAIQEGQATPEEFERGFEETPPEFFKKQYDTLNGLAENVQSLSTFCDERFGDAAPDFSPLRNSLEDVATTARVLLKQKGGAEEPPAVPAEEMHQEESPPAFDGNSTNVAAAPTQVRRAARSGTEPESQEDAMDRILAAAKYLRRENPQNSAGYLIPRMLRWGELRAGGGYPDPALLAPPASELRISLKRFASEGNWDQARELAEDAAGLPCGRAWLDLQRYACVAAQFSGLDGVMNAILAGLKSLLADLPELVHWTLADDTPTANPETMAWLKERGVLPGTPVESPATPPIQQMWMPTPEPASNGDGAAEPQIPDAYDLAMQSVQNGNVAGAFEILSRELAQEPSGRDRFVRKVQMARLCLATGNDAIAEPVLKDLAEEIDRRNLVDWELADVVAEPLTLLYQCLVRSPDSADEKRDLYARICRLQPARAVQLPR